MDEFPQELRAFRQRKTKAATLLIVVIDADDNEVEDRKKQLDGHAKNAGLDPIGRDEIALLVPKRNIETWICALQDETVTESDNYKTAKSPTKAQFRKAARRLFEWSRPNAVIGSSCVHSLSVSLPTWRLIESRLS